jgi:hypothetical protein
VKYFNDIRFSVIKNIEFAYCDHDSLESYSDSNTGYAPTDSLQIQIDLYIGFEDLILYKYKIRRKRDIS